MKYLTFLLLFWASVPAYSNDFRVCGGTVSGAERTTRAASDFVVSERMPFAVHLSWRSMRDTGSGRLRHCGGAIVDKSWVLTARHCVGDIRWKHLEVDVPALGLSTEADLSLCPLQASAFPNEDVALLRLTQPLPDGVVVADIQANALTFPFSGHVGSWPVRRGVAARQMQVSPITIRSQSRLPMLRGEMVFKHERVPCGGESGSMLIGEDNRIVGVLSAISAPSGGRPDCDDPQTEIFVTPLMDWRDWVTDTISACARDLQACSKPE